MRRLNKKIHEARLSMEPYRSNLWLWCCTPEQATKAIKGTLYYTKYHCDADAFHSGGGRCLNIEGSNIEPIIWIDSNVKKSERAINLSHEFVHAINRIFDCRGVQHDPHNDEPFAYMMTYLMTQAKKEDIW